MVWSDSGQCLVNNVLTAAPDARPDYPAESTDARVRVATERAMCMFRPFRCAMDRLLTDVDYLNSYMEPRTVIVDGNGEDPSFLAAMRFQAGTKQTVIELPENGAEEFGWLARLDSTSLSGTAPLAHTDMLHL